MPEEIRRREIRRYILLAQRQAAEGYDTPPEVLMELQDLRAKYGPVEQLVQTLRGAGDTPPERRRKLDLDIDWLTTNMGSLYRRITAMETGQKEWREKVEVEHQRARRYDWIQTGILIAFALMYFIREIWR